MKKATLISFLLIATCQSIFALDIDSTVNKKINLIVEYQFLRSTHSTYFKGGNIIIAKNISKRSSLGLGAEYAYCPAHGDNGYFLYNLNLIPVFVDYRYSLLKQSKIKPYLQADLGYSFVKYREVSLSPPYAERYVKEGGIYLKGAIGASYRINKFITPIISLGFKGFHNSLNDLDINPHGIVMSAGLNINL